MGKTKSSKRFMAVFSVGSAPPCCDSQIRDANTQLYNRVCDVQTKRGKNFPLQKLNVVSSFASIPHNRITPHIRRRRTHFTPLPMATVRGAIRWPASIFVLFFAASP
jgi:hypothetical protein